MTTTRTIKITSRASVKVMDNFYTVEYCEERSISPDLSEKELSEERAKLWETCNSECDKQIEEILRMYKLKKI